MIGLKLNWKMSTRYWKCTHKSVKVGDEVGEGFSQVLDSLRIAEADTRGGGRCEISIGEMGGYKSLVERVGSNSKRTEPKELVMSSL